LPSGIATLPCPDRSIAIHDGNAAMRDGSVAIHDRSNASGRSALGLVRLQPARDAYSASNRRLMNTFCSYSLCLIRCAATSCEKSPTSGGSRGSQPSRPTRDRLDARAGPPRHRMSGHGVIATFITPSRRSPKSL
jgi:hypothetical protein